MSKGELTGIERTLVVSYLSREVVPVTIVTEDNREIYCFTRAEFVKYRLIFNREVIYITESSDFDDLPLNSEVKVNFYFNNLGLYCDSTLIKVKNNWAFVVPDVFYKAEEKIVSDDSSFKAFLLAKGSSGKDEQKIDLLISKDYPLFQKPSLSGCDQNLISEVKVFVETVIRQSKSNSVGNALYLISAGKYLQSEEVIQFDSIKNRFTLPFLIYLDCQRVLFAVKKADMVFQEENEYELNLIFPLSGPVKNRVVKVYCRINAVYENYNRDKLCADALITDIKEEDKRFISEKLEF